MSNKLDTYTLQNKSLADTTRHYTEAIRMDRRARVESLMYLLDASTDPANTELNVEVEISADGERWSAPLSPALINDTSFTALNEWVQELDGLDDYRSPYIRFGLFGNGGNPSDARGTLAVYVRRDFE